MRRRNSAESSVTRGRSLLAEKTGEIAPSVYCAGSKESSALRFVCFAFGFFVVILILVTTASRIRNYFKSGIPTVLFLGNTCTHVLYSASRYRCRASRRQASASFPSERSERMPHSGLPGPAARRHHREGRAAGSLLGGPATRTRGHAQGRQTEADRSLPKPFSLP